MSINRKRRLKRLASAILGAVSMTGMDATPTAAREVPQERGWNWPAIGVGTAGVIGTAGLGLTMYGMFGKKSVQELVAEEQFKKLQAENKKKLEDEQYQAKVKEIKLRHGLTDAGVTNMTANFNALRNGLPPLTNDDVLANLDKQAVQDLIKTASNNSTAANNKQLLEEIVKKIQEEVTETTLTKALDMLTDTSDEEAKAGLDAIVTYRGYNNAAGAVAVDSFVQDVDKFEDCVTPGKVAQFRCVGKSLTQLKEKQRKAGDELLPADLKGLLASAMPIAIVAPALKSALGGEGAGAAAALAAAMFGGGGGDAGGAGLMNTDKARNREQILDGYRDSVPAVGNLVYALAQNMGTSRNMADAGKLPTDIVIGPQIQLANAGVAVAPNTLGQLLGLHKIENPALKKLKKQDYRKIYKNMYQKILDIVNG